MALKQATWNWAEKHQKAFEHMKKAISRETLLVCPHFSELFVIHMDTSKVQLEAIIIEDNKPIAFYSRKLNPTQVYYTTTDRGLLSIAL